MYGKIEIRGNIKLLSGMHIGGSTAFAAIGAIDSPVVRDSLTNMPMIPGSSLKGKMRSLLARMYNEKVSQPSKDNKRIVRLFGGADKDENKAVPHGKLIFSDAFLINRKELIEKGATETEVKFENNINRVTGVANPRQIERSIRGSKFGLTLIYEYDDKSNIEEDMETIAEGLKLLEKDYIGGSGTRGYGRVKFEDISLETVIGELEDIDKYRDMFSDF